MRRLRPRRSSSVPACCDVRVVGVDRCGELLHPLALVASVFRIGTFQSVTGPSASTPRISRTMLSVSGWFALFTTITSGISITPAFSACTESPEPGISASTIVSAWSMMSISAWPDADGLDQHVLLAGRVHQQHGLQGRLGQAAERAAARHRADVDALVEEVVREPDAVAEQGALGERAGGIDGQHADLALCARACATSDADQRALADAGRAGEAHDPRLARVRIDLAHQLPARGVVVLDQRDAASQRALVAVSSRSASGASFEPVPAVMGRELWQRELGATRRGAAMAAVHLPHPLEARARFVLGAATPAALRATARCEVLRPPEDAPAGRTATRRSGRRR